MKRMTIVLFLLLLLCSACAPAAPEPTPTITAIPTKTRHPTATSRPPSTPSPGPIFTTIGSPFPLEWGTPRITYNDAFNGPWRPNATDSSHGHMDVAVPEGYELCDGFDMVAHQGDILAPVDGCVKSYISDKNPDGTQLYIFDLVLDKNSYLDGIEEALEFSGIANPQLSKISDIRLNFGHTNDVKEGCFKKGDVIAELVPYRKDCGQTKLAFHVQLYYDGVEYFLTPTLFKLDPEWVCYPGSEYSCEPKSHNYAP